MKAIYGILFLVIAASACLPGGESTTSEFTGGKEGLRLAYLPNTPPLEVTDFGDGRGFPFLAVVTVSNVGEHTIPAGELEMEMTGFFPNDFSVEDRNKQLKQSNNQQLLGVQRDPSGNLIRGDLQPFTFPVADRWPADSDRFLYRETLKGNQQFPFKAEACYRYKTAAASQMCLQEDFTDAVNEVCNPSGERAVSNSGAPVHITKVSQSVGGADKIIFNFEITKVGPDEVFKPTADSKGEKCSTDFRNKDRINVLVDTGIKLAGIDATAAEKELEDAKFLVGLEASYDTLQSRRDRLRNARIELLAQTSGLNCVGLTGNSPISGELLLIDGKATFTCIQTLDENSKIDSVKTFNVELDYYAQRSITQNVLVKHLI
ncbi:hypothetical protein HYX10_05030 [Candidatus Woesearchaeota archaeon]|nr:hypothetical protein [Candidatus Woesearchaeota archaeon]